MKAADFVVMLTPFRPGSDGDLCLDCADVMLPVAPFTETGGSFVNCEGRVQSFAGATRPLGEARPAWKVLRVLGNLFGLEGFDYEDLDEVRRAIALPELAPSARLREYVYPKQLGAKEAELVRIAETPIYAVDNLVRRAPALQQTRDAVEPAAYMNPRQIEKLGFRPGEKVRVRMLEGDAEIGLVADERIPDGCVWVPAGYQETSALGAQGPATVNRI